MFSRLLLQVVLKNKLKKEKKEGLKRLLLLCSHSVPFFLFLVSSLAKKKKKKEEREKGQSHTHGQRRENPLFRGQLQDLDKRGRRRPGEKKDTLEGEKGERERGRATRG